MSAMPRPDPFTLARAGSLLITVAVLFLSASVLAQQPDEAGWMPFAEGEYRPAFEVVINGEKTIALIDTSISVNAISAQFAHAAGIEPGTGSVSVRDVQDGEQLPLSSTFTLEIGGNPVELDSAVMIPAKDVGLVIGRPMLNALVVQIDYPNRRLRILPPDMADFEGNAKLRRGHFNQPMIEARINDKPAWMNLDTSSDTICLLTDRAVGKHDLSGSELAKDNLRIDGVAMRPDVKTMLLDRFELGPFKIEDVIAATPIGDEPDSKSYGAHRIHQKFGGDGILGYEVMRHFLVTFALGRDNVHFHVE